LNINLDFLPATAFVFLLIFARVGAMVMSLPGIGDRNVPVTIRLVFALALSWVLYFGLQRTFPPLPPTLWSMLAVFGRELIIGVVLGVLIRLIMFAVQLAGALVGFQTGLAFASSVDPNFGEANVVGTLLSMMALALIFNLDLHHLLLRGIVDSYQLFGPTMTVPIGDFAELATRLVAGAFRVSLQMAAPFIVFGLVFYLGLGIIARLIPQIQVFFIAQPAAISLSLILFMILLSGMMSVYLGYYAQSLEPFLAAR
jgi:flagellar biosynthetic protein FliR